MKQTCRLTLPLMVLCLAASASFASDGRTEISQDMIPYQIDNAGSYVVTENLSAGASQNGITVNADNVTIDLNGFSIYGITNSFNGIVSTSSRINVTVINGSVRDCGDDGIDLSTAVNCLVKNVRASNNGAAGIQLGDASTVIECTAIGNGSSTNHNGITTAGGSVVSACVTRDNTGDGIEVGNASTISSCVARENHGHGIEAGDAAMVTGCNARDNDSHGIVVGSGCHVTDSVGYSNDDGFHVRGVGSNISRCTAFGNLLYGIRAGSGNSVIHSTAYDNQVGNIHVGSECYVFYNNCVSTNSSSGGIVVDGTDSRLENNHLLRGAFGFDVNGTDNFIVKNTAAECTTEYDIVGGNQTGLVVNTPAGAGAWDNFNF
ncbi:MAG: right-handed parallel beta-helix repeat-containing protein [Verrucomicrobia bacterium]|nr:right-handed parallel beta-helix repeat-containing protein [Verrucomicrobiota bacterium]